MGRTLAAVLQFLERDDVFHALQIVIIPGIVFLAAQRWAA